MCAPGRSTWQRCAVAYARSRPRRHPLAPGPDDTGHRPAATVLLGRQRYLTRGNPSADGRYVERVDDRAAEHFYRDRWRHDLEVRSTHGVNCTGSCSWKVFVRDGIVSWETQAVDYPETPPDMPDHEPRGCPRGATFSWYIYNPSRVRYPYVRGPLLDLWHEALAAHGDPVDAWASIVEDPAKAAAYKGARGRGGFVRATWDEVYELIAAAHVHTIKAYGPDRVAGFTPLPAMSPVSYSSGSRYLALTGGAHLSFYDWYADLPPASPQVFGDQTDVPEAADWWNASYLLVWGSNIPVTRSPDSHFMVEARYRGQKVVVVSPDYAEQTKFADDWLAVAPGSDSALAMAMGHVILNDFHVREPVPAFVDYVTTYTDMPFLVTLDPGPDGAYVPGHFVTASDLGDTTEGAAWKTVLLDSTSGEAVVPNGSVGFRWTESGVGKWNLDLGDITPALSCAELDGHTAVEVHLPRFDVTPAGILRRGVPVRQIGDRIVTTVYDLLLAQYGVERDGLPGEWPSGYDDAATPYTPAWQEQFTKIPAGVVTRIAREFARNAEVTGGRSMIVLGAGSTHWFNSDVMYRAAITILSACGTIGRNGGGWAHYVGQEKIRTFTGWVTLAHALDWSRPPRQCNGTAWFYLATDQWRYEVFGADELSSPLGRGTFDGCAPIDCLAHATRLGWQVTYPTFDRNPLDLADAAAEAGADTVDHVVESLRRGDLHFSVEDPDDPRNFPRLLFVWRANVLGSSGKGHEYFLRHLLGAEDNASALETPAEKRPQDVRWRDEAPTGKLDLLVNLDFRMTSTAHFGDIVLPAATWYEKYDLSMTDMHPFVHSFNAAIDPPWESRTDWDAFDGLARVFSRLAADHLGVRHDVVATSIGHDTPGETAQPGGIVADWRAGETEPVPGRTMPHLTVVERDFSAVHDKYTSLGPLVESAGVGCKGVEWKPTEVVAWLGEANGEISDGAGRGRPSLASAEHVAEAILALSGATNGSVAWEGFRQLGTRVGKPLTGLVEGERDRHVRWSDAQFRPQQTLTSPEWSGDESGSRRYSAFTINVEHLKPWHTLTGRIHMYLDHDWFAEYGEQMPIFRPPLNMPEHYPDLDDIGSDAIVLRYLTPHSKWSIHSEYQDNLVMLTLGRGGPVMWLSVEDAAQIGVADNDWIEAWNRNGIVDCRAVVSPRMPRGLCYVYHAKDRHVQTPRTERTGRFGGTENSLTRILLKPTHMVGGYAQLSYGFNYYGCAGIQRDEVTVVRRRGQDVRFE
ncbi:MAG: nitrate reductase subunit alpha [Acidimicrobiia bacterium]|nr:nitrate reductase subunit alpha [Acidimicrobiia bacterium]